MAVASLVMEAAADKLDSAVKAMLGIAARAGYGAKGPG
jgi:hypothetical protein